MDKIKYLSRIKLFHELEWVELQRIESITPIHIFKKKEIIASPLSAQKYLYLIKSGSVRLYRLSEGGKELTVDLLGVGHVFGEIGSFTTGSENMYAEAREEAIICKVDKTQFESILRERPSLALNFIEIISTRLKEVEEMLEYMAYGSVRKRLLFLLYKLSIKFGVEVHVPEAEVEQKMWIQFNIPLTHQELASMMGSLRETVTTGLHELALEGIIKKPVLRKPLIVEIRRLKAALEEAR
ncbi:Crp/Fnr family transcriptional regulator [Paenibacillus sp. SYP-B3998]|uniref:Crp/Fnr family transcriptional regulator n=1 Tax=Paenibacillus sp. SYP-B3998 TaxID=2678564 RepID=A0A6G3ZWV9_9BACL|nr:Crp/Fnr family transcriptional regulator [Paenibacillus sp. SYP-B3998]NEW06706.1 Crp/Fnr family transcriptional regulator [Paenibacillus sp. SYP-B3998]